MSNFAETNHFDSLMEGSNSTVGSAANVEIKDGEIKSTAPLASQIEQGALGYTGGDYVPSANKKRYADAPVESKSSITVKGEVFLDPSGEDYVSPTETQRRSSLRSNLIEKFAESIIGENAEKLKRYNKAREYIQKHSGAEFDTLSPEVQKRLKNAMRLVEKGPPIDEEEARRQAIVRAHREIIKSQ